MDSGLLGEHVLQTVIHAWDQLLRPFCPQLLAALDADAPPTGCGIVVPFGARVWATPVQCPSIARYSYVAHEESSAWSFKSTWLFSEINEPYDTENLRNIKDCKFLCDPKLIFTFDFNNPFELKEYFEGKKDGKVISFCHKEKADAIAIWFDLLLDEDITISSSPFTEDKLCGWDQAIFRFKRPEISVKFQVNCGGGKLDFKLFSECFINTDKELTKIQSRLNSRTTTSEIALSKHVINFINNRGLQEVLYKLPENVGNVKRVLDLSPFPMLGLSFMKFKDVNLYCVLKTAEEVTAVKEFVKENSLISSKVKCLFKYELKELLSAGCVEFDFIFYDLFQPTGELKESVSNIIPKLVKMLVPGGVLAPVSLTAMCQLIDSEWISLSSTVLNDELTQTYKIAEFINLYQVSQQLDVDLKNVSYTLLSDMTACMQLSISELAADLCRNSELRIIITRDGCVTAVPLWFEYQLYPGGRTLSTFTENSYLNQIVFVVHPPIQVKTGETLSVNITYHCGIFRLKIKS